MTNHPHLRWFAFRTQPSTIVVVLHGGSESSTEPVTRLNTSWLRMWDFARAVAKRPASTDVAVVLVRNTVRGWNGGTKPSALTDARWVLDKLTQRHPDAGVILVGHSLGGRVACALADYPSVRGVVVLAPWLPGTTDASGASVLEPMRFDAGTALAVAHGTADLWCAPAQSLTFCNRAVAAGVPTVRAEMPGAGHFLLHRPGQWRRFVRLAVTAIIDRTGPFDGSRHEVDIRQPIGTAISDLQGATGE
ncbi:alpha/beta hydrolase family protein [Antricoccus suffuscus]|uniref:Alpha/beta hydrolase family protein n=1 Tax=Antricoccus suffuscus TaxID=1629062 RepID=A0A2T0Z035_9ACTN|nr:alpha/beta fold hydrolase [Antricoccus suffuscus]PRZ29700.1 alpha/beta hydrolase family protein [Antricoccus suffuscus]